MKNFLRIILVFLVLLYVVIPSVKLLFLSDEIKQDHVKHTNSFKVQKGKIKNIETIFAEKYPVNYDKDMFKRIYSYHIISDNLTVQDTLYETVKKSTYFFEQLRPSYSVGEIIKYYKSETESPKLITEMDYDYMMDNTNSSSIKWFSFILLLSGVASIILLAKPIFKILKS